MCPVPAVPVLRLAAVALACSALTARADAPGREGATPKAAPGVRTPLALGDVDYRGELWTRYAAATCNLLTRGDRYPLGSFRASASGTPGALWWDWPGDQVGRWLSVLHVGEAHGWTPARAARAAIADIVLPLQTEQGNFGPPVPLDQRDVRVISGNAFALRGLVDAFEDTGDRRYLEAARRLGRYFEAVAPYWRVTPEGHMHEFYGHCLDGLVRLHELGGDEWALDLATSLAAGVGRTPHTHHSLSMYRGVLELYRVTGDPQLLARTDDYLEWCRECRLVSGGLPESMPTSGQDEGCGLADYLVVNLMAYSLTGEDAYLDDAEHLLVNHFLMNQFHTGGFGHRSFGQEIVGGKQWQGWDGRFGSENPGCCSLWGAWALGELGRYIVTRAGEDIEVNLYPAAYVRVRERGLMIEIDSDFPRMSHARIKLHCDEASRFALRLRVPGWAESCLATCNGDELEPAAPGQRLVLDRRWHSGDVIELWFPSAPRLVHWPTADAPTVAVFDGPLCLALSSAAGDVDAFRYVRADEDGRPLPDGQGRPIVLDADGHALSGLAPMADDWLSSPVADPNRLRILFELIDG